jgi:beta-lactamase class A
VWLAEATGRLGGAAAQTWLYPLLTGTVEETGIPAGVPAGTTVVHKTGWYDTVEDDAALVNGPHGQYVLVVCTDGDASDAGWSLLAQISQRVWQYEQSRS